MFYKFMVHVVRVIVALINGNTHFQGKENLPNNESFIMVAPHRTWWEPILFALAVSPLPCAFMAKKELFKNPIYALFCIMPTLFLLTANIPVYPLSKFRSAT